MQDFRPAVREAVRGEAALRGALAEADIAPMLMVLVQLTGDLDFLEEVAPHIHGSWSFLQSVLTCPRRSGPPAMRGRRDH